MIVTSRRRLSALEEAVSVSLDTLPPSEAAKLLALSSARLNLRPKDSAITDLAKLCGCLPLAVRLVAAKLRHHPAWAVTDLIAELAEARNRPDIMRAENISVAAAFDLPTGTSIVARSAYSCRLGSASRQ